MSVTLREAWEILESCWVDNGCSIDVTFFEDSGAWVATLYINSAGDDVEGVAEVRDHLSPSDAVQALEQMVLQDEALLRRLERLAWPSSRTR